MNKKWLKENWWLLLPIVVILYVISPSFNKLLTPAQSIIKSEYGIPLYFINGGIFLYIWFIMFCIGNDSDLRLYPKTTQGWLLPLALIVWGFLLTGQNPVFWQLRTYAKATTGCLRRRETIPSYWLLQSW